MSYLSVRKSSDESPHDGDGSVRSPSHLRWVASSVSPLGGYTRPSRAGFGVGRELQQCTPTFRFHARLDAASFFNDFDERTRRRTYRFFPVALAASRCRPRCSSKGKLMRRRAVNFGRRLTAWSRSCPFPTISKQLTDHHPYPNLDGKGPASGGKPHRTEESRQDRTACFARRSWVTPYASDQGPRDLAATRISPSSVAWHPRLTSWLAPDGGD